MIEVQNLSKQFGATAALTDVTLCFEENKIYGLLGRNGAGKSTLLKLLTNRIFPSAGTILVDGESALEHDNAQEKLFLMSEKTLYPEKMKLKDAIKWSKTFYPNFDTDYAEKISREFNLNLKKSIKSLSTGYTSIFKLVLALSANTPYLLLDEPVLGLDANHRELFYRLLIEKYSVNPCTIIISTHLIEEVSGIIEDIIIIDEGRVLTNESCQALLSRGYTVSGPAGKVMDYVQGKEVLGIDSLGGLKSAYILGKAEAVPEGLEVGSLDLQKLFVKLTEGKKHDQSI